MHLIKDKKTRLGRAQKTNICSLFYCIRTLVVLTSNIWIAPCCTKESCAEVVANGVAGDPSAVEENAMGLYVVYGDNKQLVALGKMYQLGGMIHNIPYADEVVRVSVVTVYDGDARAPIPTPEIEYAREAMNTFIG
ncbi:hypothetical protein JHK87_031708 [Glycine soja]|nr:hypothetical protein JHK87_031708 [Glycine soja]